jgi:hypothetical protein
MSGAGAFPDTAGPCRAKGIARRRKDLFRQHRIVDSPGERQRPVPLLGEHVNNLMLMCHVHHKLIDVDEVAEHPEPPHALTRKSGRPLFRLSPKLLMLNPLNEARRVETAYELLEVLGSFPS